MRGAPIITKTWSSSDQKKPDGIVHPGESNPGSLAYQTNGLLIELPDYLNSEYIYQIFERNFPFCFRGWKRDKNKMLKIFGKFFFCCFSGNVLLCVKTCVHYRSSYAFCLRVIFGICPTLKQQNFTLIRFPL